MKVKVNRKFLKDLYKVPDKKRKLIEQLVFEESEAFASIQSISGLEKLKGYDDYYRLRFGEYRVGMKITANTITFERVLHRKDIYRYFP